MVRKSQEISNSAYITSSHLGEFPEKSSALIQSQTPAYSVAKHYWNIKWTGFCGQMKLKRAFWHTRALLHTGIKRYPMPTVKYPAGSLMLWAYIILPEVLNILLRNMASWILEDTNIPAHENKISQLGCLC